MRLRQLQSIAAFISLGFSLHFVLLGTEPQDEIPDDLANQERIKTRPVDFDREISPIFSQYCLECHGPDADARKAGLRLDDYASATSDSHSDRQAIHPGSPEQSELIRRITSTDPDERMPPPETGPPLTDAQVNTLTTWISEGAPYKGHWAFQPIASTILPPVADTQWPNQALDHFILAPLEAANIKPSESASRRDLIRRLTYDLTGLPPSPEAIERFLDDASPNAYETVVNRLLSSPGYGERWGRHWLDVARYGDSNGGDENHAYPHAFHYRNYVIDAFNAGTAFDQFLIEQLAGDLLPPTPDPFAQLNRLKATGFLAIGTKILAEQDPVKKRADLIDEQIDTIGRALMGVTIACARCHDHKFDPIPTKDYYALAGILHSTELEDQPLKTPAFLQAEATYRQSLAALKEQLTAQEMLWEQARSAEESWSREAEQFDRGNVVTDKENYGKDIGIISDPGGQENFAEYDLHLASNTTYAVELRYAAEKARPGKIFLDETIVTQEAFSQITGGWHPKDQQWVLEGTFQTSTGQHRLRLESQPMMVHIDKIRLTPLNSSGNAKISIAKLQSLRKQWQEAQSNAPEPQKTMAVKDGDVRDIAVHLRGNHNALGETIRRGPLTEIGETAKTAIPPHSSGRLEFARWLTHRDHPLTARVIANRVWRWHFGRGLVETTDNFGTRGARPSHPELLDYLARFLVQQDWSLKALHRTIVLSSTYRLSATPPRPVPSGDPTNLLYWKRDLRRLEAEAFRDTLVSLSGRLSHELGGGEMNVKSQDPSPADLVTNRERYESSQRRSVYLPIVRSNVYDLLTLLDFPNANTPVGNRPTTTVPTQALLLMNHSFIQEEAERIVQRIRRETPASSQDGLVERLYWELLGRPPEDSDQAIIQTFLQDYERTLSGKDAADSSAGLNALCHTLLMSNEFSHLP